MSNPRRNETIERVLRLLKVHWRNNPDLEFGQLVSELVPEEHYHGGVADPLSVPDDLWANALECAIKEARS